MSEGDASRIPPHHDPACWGCGENPTGIRLAQPRAEGVTEYEAYFHFDEQHQGGPGIVHGGLVGAVLDEACGLLATWHNFPAVTARIFVRFRRPVPINTELLVAARVTESRGRRIRIVGKLLDGDDALAEAKAAFLHVPLAHFLATPEGQAAADAWKTRLAAADDD
jgi:acyl-coenzyme A thioesterase PaaI-like protein